MGFELREVVVESGGRRRLGPLNLELGGGELVGVVGPNGSGKTTLLRILYGYLTPTSGQVTLDHVPLTTINAKAFSTRVGACPQEAEPSLDFSVEQALALSTGGDLERAKAYAEKLDFLGLENLWGRRLSQLSGGEKQRVRLARAFFPDPSWLVLDEPANHLDLATGWALMERLRSRRGGVVVALHDLSFAVRFCHRLLILRAGELVAWDEPEKALSEMVLEQVFGLNGRVVADGEALRLEIEGVSGR